MNIYVCYLIMEVNLMLSDIQQYSNPISVLDEIIREQTLKPNAPSFAITKLLKGDTDIFRSIVTYPELDGYAITSNGFIFRDRPLMYALTENGRPYLTDVYGYDFYDESCFYNIKTKFGFYFRVFPLQVILREFFGYDLDMDMFEKSWLDYRDMDIDDLTPFLIPLENSRGYGTKNYFTLFNC